MENNNWQAITKIFDEALEQDKSDRTAFIAQACGGDEILRREVESLLHAHQQADNFLLHAVTKSLPAASRNDAAAITSQQRIGPYQLIREIAQGGMGTVWLAERADDQYCQHVAIKLIKAGADSADIAQRLRHERQILADLNHPNIARLLDGGTTENGQPYLVMEYIEGVSLNVYCHQQQLPLRARLQLFQQVCTAVEYAHQHLIIHRDLKPSNILVTADGIPKLLDFGIAKLLQPDLSESYQTQTGMHPMTPAYASPEQVRGEKLTTTSDVYSLGVLLYELLTGRSPYQLKENNFNEMMRAIIEQEPTPPSERAKQTMNDERGTMNTERPEIVQGHLIHPSSFILHHSALRGDLDAIVLKALRKEPHSRYSSVEQFNKDIRCYLEGLLVSARKGTFNYRAVRFIRRHSIPVAAAALVVLSLFGGLGATSRQAQIARAAQLNAEAERLRAEQALVVADKQRRRAEQALAEVEAERTRTENALTTAEQRRQQAETARVEANQQRAQAQTQRVAAEAERNVAQTQRQRAEAQELSKRQLLYASQMKLAQAAWDESNVDRVRELVMAHQPVPGQEDLRGFEWHWLWQLSHAEVTTLPKHSFGPVASFSADGKSLITSNYSSAETATVIRIWDATTWQEKGSFRVAGNPMGRRSVISPDGDMIAMSLASSCEVVLWDVASAQVRWRLPVSDTCQRLLSFSPDGKRLLARDLSRVTLFDTQSGQELIRFNVHRLPENFYRGVFNPDGKTFATVGSDFQIHFYNLQTGKEVQTMARQDSDEKIGSIFYSPTGRYLILSISTTKTSFGEIVIQDTQTHREVQRIAAIGMPVFSPNEQYLVVPKDREIRILDTEKWQERAAFKVQNVERIAFAPQGGRFVTAGLDAVKIWDLNVSLATTSYAIDNTFAQAITFSPDSQKLYVKAYSPSQANNYSITKGWELITQREANSFLNSGSPTARQSLSPDGSKLAYSSQQEILIKDTNTNAELLRLNTNGGVCHDISWSPDGGKLVTVIGLTIWIWNAQKGQLLQSIPPPAMSELFKQAVLLRDQKTLLLLGEARLYFYDLTTRKLFRTVLMRDAHTSSMTLSADETKIAVGLVNGEVHLYNATSGTEFLTLQGHSRFINQLSFSSDMRRLATSSEDSTVRVWDLLTGQDILLFRDTASGGGVAFSPDGKHLAVAFQKGVVKVFSAAK